ncbi:ABC transporter permease [Neobacillus terrae]|uniref:ABC transporter permease n=1 Tax=Neobacillus terrae TaxID=3034837 RepID=UPI00140B52A1|nr:ABC transporter permease [Neobacillus terrae]NHM30684.1 ABC transporter permease [Neobacillus terrae]
MNDLLQFISSRHSEILQIIWQHVYISFISVGAGFIVAIPLGIILTKFEKLSKYILGFVNIIQTIPSLALLGFMIPLLGIGVTPAISALFLYSLLPMLQNTYTGIKDVDPALTNAAKGMGMTELQILMKVEIPMAVSVIMSGFRTATIYTISWATLASLIGGGGLGYLVFTGLATSNNNMIIAGALGAVLLATLTEFLTRKLQFFATPKGLRK